MCSRHAAEVFPLLRIYQILNKKKIKEKFYAEFSVEIMGLRLATGFGGLKPTHSLAPVTTYKSGM